MDVGEAGQGTPFDSMTHEAMLAWLDRANSGAVKGASDRLLSAATEIKKVATELKDRPQRVSWEGEGAKAFRTWSADLANATLRLGDFSSGVSEWLAEASNAIATAQASVPRTHAGAQANLDAARIARNDPDASTVAREAAETLIATQEANRQEAADQMRRLAQAYAFSAKKMDALERPVFPPPPGAIVPDEADRRGAGGAEARGTGGLPVGSGASYAAGTEGRTVHAAGDVAGTKASHVSLPVVPVSSRSTPVAMEIDGVAILPNAAAPPTQTSPTSLGLGKTENGLSVTAPNTLAPTFGGGAVPPQLSNGGKTAGVPRTFMPSAGAGPSGTGPVARSPRDAGIVGGRPVSQASGRPSVGLPRGTAVGEGIHGGRAPMAHGGSSGGAGGAQNGIVGGRRLAGETGGVVGGRSQQPGRSVGRPFTPGGSGLVRSTPSAQGGRAIGPIGRPGSPAKPAESRREEGERPDYLVEDEETWQQGGRRVVPPVIE
ncbi:MULTISPECIES: hypothetical protein [unclassified Streptomyces]|uniref:hypothetical protein n=1 Tax=unclassified Streptomyces TaxID=2593676 RepID=UPI0001C1AC70|nr:MULTISPECIES: hypothetical protein [unclassified Streptomyces]AEN10306.1 conserved hypothetical protein [Streptomyces sp. SirexAA-E]MYR64985.1 hypothetical protein [Streptomyces sp. SID4939]MYT65457.1 hypothetical protein [Streptomyces sp. SID8357]MYT84512.1 hypothetical protein [Streptomyces sp. SID8360]MYW37778.1 hypothetical protein [Streptomyces sp. SID1]